MRLESFVVAAVVAVGLVGCGSQTKKVDVEIKINGQPVPMLKKENDPAKASAELAKQKAKYLDESGELKAEFRKTKSDQALARLWFQGIANKHPETEAGREAKAIADKLK